MQDSEMMGAGDWGNPFSHWHEVAWYRRRDRSNSRDPAPEAEPTDSTVE